MIEIRRAEIKDIPSIMRFIDEYWKKDHILATDRKFFDWQFVEDGKVNVYIGIEDTTGEIFGTMGFVLYNHSESPDISGCIWKVKKSKNPMLGLQIQNFLNRDMNVRYSIASMLRSKAQKIAMASGYEPTKMDHYYRIGNRSEYRIAVINNDYIPLVEDFGYRLVEIHSVDEMKQVISEDTLREGVLSKDYRYIRRRYFEHPMYDYHIWKICKESESKAILITREVEYNGAKACKIIDYYGESEYIQFITHDVDKWIQKNGYEYVDVYSYGLPYQYYEQAGFLRCDEKSENVIPNHFYPFEQKNVDLDMVNPKIEKARLFRGDGDQDRPG